MVQFIMDRNLLLYALAASCAIGVVSQLILKQLYERLLKDTRITGEPTSRFLQQLRQRFQYCTHLNDKVGNVQALVQKSVIEYRFWGMSLHQWKRIGLQCLVVSLLCAFCGTAVTVQAGGSAVAGNVYLWMGALAAVLTAVAYGIADTGYSSNCLEIRLTDYLENSGVVRDYAAEDSEFEQESRSGYGESQSFSQDGSQGYGTASGAVSQIVSVAEGRKSKRRARAEAAAAAQAAETRAQKEKRELKENLARVKAGMQETAAGQEKERERNADVLRQMDPKEQERILREVLKEFLS